ncbi:unnamed protein product [Schistosoma turkestanicum]|nr:unnamed protein product [Schistosoma turkestanicum]
MENVNTDKIYDEELKTTTTTTPTTTTIIENIHNNITLSLVTVDKKTTESNNPITDAVWTEKEQRVTVIIAVSLVAIITICVSLFILRTLKKKSNKKVSRLPNTNQKKTSQSDKANKVEWKGNYSPIISVNHSEPKCDMQQQSTTGHPSDRIRKVPTRNPENKKWYDSTAIPFMDDVSSSMDTLNTGQLKNQQT